MKRLVVLLAASILALLSCAAPSSAHQPHPGGASSVPLNTYHAIGYDGLRVKTISIDKNANSEVYYNTGDRPRYGYQFVIVRVRVKNNGYDWAHPYGGLKFFTYGKATGRTYFDSPVVGPDDLTRENWIGYGDYVTGNLVFEVRKTDIPYKLRLRVNVMYGEEDTGASYNTT